jgi:hypothetical protein
MFKAFMVFSEMKRKIKKHAKKIKGICKQEFPVIFFNMLF